MICEAQAEHLAYLRRAGETRDVDGGLAIRTGGSSNTRDGVVAHGPVEDVAALGLELQPTPPDRRYYLPYR